jgi:hypothetical protein
VVAQLESLSHSQELLDILSPTPYQGIKYKRSDLQFIRIPLDTFASSLGISVEPQVSFLLEHLPAGAVIAGGSVAAWACNPPRGGGTKPSDIDIFFAGEKAQEVYLQTVGFLETRYARMEGTGIPSGVTMFRGDGDHLNVQAVHFDYYDDAETVLDGFDFTVCQFGIDVGTRTFIFNPVAFSDYVRRRLVSHRYEGDCSYTKRLYKYVSKGFIPIGDVLAQAVRLQVTDGSGKLLSR